jgi:hypothetical protein
MLFELPLRQTAGMVAAQIPYRRADGPLERLVPYRDIPA